jgi:hypothetical protein
MGMRAQGRAGVRTMRGIYKCADVHLFQRTFKSMFLEANLGPKRHLAKCPIDGKLGVIVRVTKRDLTEQQIAEVIHRSSK